MPYVKKGDMICIHYTGKLEDGTVFDSTEGHEPLQIKVGDGEFLKELEEGVVGMSPGESKTVHMGQIYGPHNEEMVFDFDRKRIPQGMEIVVGQRLQLHRADGMPVKVTVVGVSEHSVTMDCNHPLAGKNLIYDVTLEKIV